ncbi:hypothetical protein ASPWEDRAFT_54022 [Aspergillus wentii DTO 134E9]|uniref:Allergen Asp f 15 n=1 Tax=Aspergillus wentii DTO 134E9 TaxID=1073089 RepID=A0A1L9RBV1_ASPWE|nr:uncharacterized protein ASPWEDRAFT_54022 [Aspergillus wentii DTO 134E9]KAI9934954.1 hypothetical protein MW887_000575 [Aspergillus wentii]OJJ32396.1 hypothetical protein ASPWEDRAFT_54022 [Aspergillus wentii DTO 134E9]
MQLLTILSLLTTTLATPLLVPRDTSTVSYDTKFDDASTSLNTVSCSDGVNGLVSKYPTFGDLPGFPLIGGAPTVAGWNSPNCGKCYAVTYGSQTVHVIAVDAAPGGFNLGVQGMNKLTDGRAVELGRVDVSYSEADKALCGF